MLDPIRSAETPVGRGFTVEFTFLPYQQKLKTEWSPWPPSRQEMRRILSKYRPVRQAFLDRVTEATGLKIAVAEVAL